MESHDDKTPDVRQDEHVSRQRRWLRWTVAGCALLVACGLLWYVLDARETSRLGRDTRVVVRFPESVIDRLTADEIEEQFPIQESAGDLELTGTANAVGQVSIQIRPHKEHARPDDATILVQVVGETDNELIGKQAPVRIIGNGRGTFVAATQVHFDGFRFEADDETIVEATHETEIVDVEPLPGTPLKGAVRLLASRSAREALPELNRLAAGRIEELVRQRVDELIGESLAKLNKINQFDETIAKLHPSAERWRIAVGTRNGYVQAALVPEQGRTPVLPADQPTTLEVWIRLTRTQRTGMNLLSHWRQAHTVFRELVSAEQARRLADDLTVADVGEWTYLRIGAATLDPDHSTT